MTVREYVGARYVPLFMGDWSSAVSYEPLSIVSHQGDSYTSKQYVPTGKQITDEQYWAKTGNYNAQVEAYRQEVQTFDGRITDAQGDVDALESYIGKFEDDIVIIGDSWSEPYSARHSTTWTRWLGDYTKADIHNYARGGSTVSGSPGNWNFNGNFRGQVDAVIADTSFTHSKVGLIIIEGGVNDYRGGLSYNTVVDSFNSHISRLHAEFPKARIICVLNHEVLISDEQYRYMHTVQFSLSKVAECYTTFDWLLYPGEYNTTDYVHPNENGYKTFLQDMLAIMYGGVPNPKPEYMAIDFTDNNSNRIKFLLGSYETKGVLQSIGCIYVPVITSMPSGYVIQFDVNRDGEITTEGFTLHSISNFKKYIVNPATTFPQMIPNDYPTTNKNVYFGLTARPADINEVRQVTNMHFAIKFVNYDVQGVKCFGHSNGQFPFPDIMNY